MTVGKIRNLKGKKFGRLTALHECGRDKRRYVLWRCKCECGNIVDLPSVVLIHGYTSSCGCLARDLLTERNTKHGMSWHPLYIVWKGIKARCQNPNDLGYKNYGGRGICVCDEWQEFAPFMEWALANGYKQGLDLDRRNNDGDYSPDNCRFVTRTVNNRNKRTNRRVTINGVERTVIEWSEKSGISSRTLVRRLNLGWNPEDILKPPRVLNKC